MKPLPLRAKVALLSAGLSGLVVVVFGVFAWMTFYQERIAAVDREIKTLIARHPGLFAGRGSFERLESSLAFAYGDAYTNEVFLLMKDSAGRTIYESPRSAGSLPDSSLSGLWHSNKPTTVSEGLTNLLTEPARTGNEAGQGWGRGGHGRGGPPPPVAFSTTLFVTVRDGASVWRIGIMGSDDLQLAFGLNLRAVDAEMDRVQTAFTIMLPLALLLIALTGWMVAGRALRPLNDIAQTAEAVTAQGLNLRIPNSDESPEIKRVITLLNRMIDRLEISFKQATRFSADASHELKTPLAVMQGELELALQASPTGSSEQRLCSHLLENVQQLTTITRSLLVLAQADTGQLKLTREEVDLTAELEDLVEDAQAIGADKNLAFETDLPPGIRVQADRALLRMALFNLLSNSSKYNQADGKTRVELSQVRETINVIIGNSGPGIPPEEQTKIFDRFHRAQRKDHAPVDGLGLGLSLAREIARAHRGDLILLESSPSWTAFKFSMPIK